jgi:hypothetical protein
MRLKLMFGRVRCDFAIPYSVGQISHNSQLKSEVFDHVPQNRNVSAAIQLFQFGRLTTAK